MYKLVTLKKGYKGFIGGIPVGYELIFLYDNIQYNLKFIGKKKYKPSTSELIKVANSMVFFMEPWRKSPDNLEN